MSAEVLKQDTIFEVGNYSQFGLADFYLSRTRRLLVCRLRYRNKSYFFIIFCSGSAALHGGQEWFLPRQRGRLFTIGPVFLIVKPMLRLSTVEGHM